MVDVNALQIRIGQLEEEREELSFSMVEAEGDELRDMEDRLEEIEEEIDTLQFQISEYESFVAIAREK